MFAQFAAALVLTVADVYFGIVRFYYYYYPWFDNVTHLLGGMWAGFFCTWLLSKRGLFNVWYCVGGVFLIGVAWEIFEASFGLTQFPADTFDTGKDIVVDIIGGVAAYAIAAYSRRR